ncbi:hypothetical protein DAPPUDRAFT_305262 [Daphnia pulex]|uniref:LRAT domain-containing protein n=1 Tax=Daphnia pulex TaxID=6669 RepID=E9GQZ7_DAPPU|nr:hypothetical protein DAPPUDRAFT_305262 [Daphnia pulex]|eukprot:EFX78205.1 hypothetical protein DAPPUDRAFT_305262 [Daphnia pulex]
MGSWISYTSTNYGIPLYYFDPDVELTPERPDYCSTKWELKEKIENLPDSSEKINEVRYYTHPLNWWQMSKYVLHHAFIVLETESWWWSIEKDEGGITIQRSKHLENVLDQCRRHGRITGLATWINLGVTCEKKGPSHASVIDVVNRMWREECLHSDYHFLQNNCKHFANTIYDNFVLMSNSNDVPIIEKVELPIPAST